jgi:hypothetical protein
MVLLTYSTCAHSIASQKWGSAPSIHGREACARRVGRAGRGGVGRASRRNGRRYSIAWHAQAEIVWIAPSLDDPRLVRGAQHREM